MENSVDGLNPGDTKTIEKNVEKNITISDRAFEVTRGNDDGPVRTANPVVRLFTDKNLFANSAQEKQCASDSLSATQEPIAGARQSKAWPDCHASG